MPGLILLAGGLAVLSGLLGLFGRGRTPGTVRLVPLLELLAGAGVPAYVLTKRPSPGVNGFLLTLLLVMVLGTAALRVIRARARRIQRQDTEAARLNAHIRYLSALKSTEEAD